MLTEVKDAIISLRKKYSSDLGAITLDCFLVVTQSEDPCCEQHSPKGARNQCRSQVRSLPSEIVHSPSQMDRFPRATASCPATITRAPVCPH